MRSIFTIAERLMRMKRSDGNCVSISSSGSKRTEMMRDTADVHSHIISVRFDPLDVPDTNEDDPAVRFEGETLGFPRVRSQTFQQRGQALVRHTFFTVSQSFARMRQRFLETLTVERFQQIINRVHFKGLERVLVVSRHKYHQRHRLARDRRTNLETTEPRHLHIEKNQVRSLLLDRGDRLSSIAAFADDIEIALEPEQL